MNIANKLTVLRVVFIPVFLVFALNGDVLGGAFKWMAIGVFVLAAATDWFDGKLARKHKLVSDFGKFADPLADKILVSAALIVMVQLGQIQSWIVIVIVAREFIISGFRLMAATNGLVIAASWWGKVKTFETMGMIIFVMAEIPGCWARIADQILIYAALILTVVSLLHYLYKNRKILKEMTM